MFVRKDLSHPQQVVQASHACIEAAKKFLHGCFVHPHLVVFGVDNEAHLNKCMLYLAKHAIQFVKFLEPDRDNETTALATEPLVCPEKRKLLRRYQLLKTKKENLNETIL